MGRQRWVKWLRGGGRCPPRPAPWLPDGPFVCPRRRRAGGRGAAHRFAGRSTGLCRKATDGPIAVAWVYPSCLLTGRKFPCWEISTQTLPQGREKIRIKKKKHSRNAMEPGEGREWSSHLQKKTKKFPFLSRHLATLRGNLSALLRRLAKRSPPSKPPASPRSAAKGRAAACAPGRGSLLCINQPGRSAELGPVARN